MKLSIFSLLVFFVASFAFADGAPALTVKITSFTRVDTSATSNSTVAELCGTVTINDSLAMPKYGNMIPVTITSDPNSGNPGMYTVMIDRTGNFCSLINSYTGTAQAEAWLGGGTQTTSELAHLGLSRR
jgi:hypothetical protein